MAAPCVSGRMVVKRTQSSPLPNPSARLAPTPGISRRASASKASISMFSALGWLGARLVVRPTRAVISLATRRTAPPVTASRAFSAKASAADDDSGPWMVVGLGNPGRQYDHTRHNIGFDVLDAVSAKEGIPIDRKEHKALVGRGMIEDKSVILVKPQTYMNDSGKAVAKIANYYKIPLARVLVVYDDMDSEVAVLKVKKNGGHGGHNGIRSIIDCCGNSKEFPRVRFGVGRPKGSMPVVSHVLTRFDKGDQPDVDVTVQQAIEAIRAIMSLGLAKAMSTQPWTGMNKS
mmetsp:Transcript_56076/g.177687  ORF Transcript_56076/g.177687 Transcript_56076/m.177687 type:complete len:289 (+) Transcript_56076:121-987(+)